RAHEPPQLRARVPPRGRDHAGRLRAGPAGRGRASPAGDDRTERGRGRRRLRLRPRGDHPPRVPPGAPRGARAVSPPFPGRPARPRPRAVNDDAKETIMDIAIPIFDEITALDAIGPYEVLSRLPGARVRFVAVAAGTYRTDKRLGLVADEPLSA